jgi:sugar (pentulose or hexulose) kinase
MNGIRHAIGVDISTQSIAAMLIGVVELRGAPSELVISSAWTASRPCADEAGRKAPSKWVELIRECIRDLRRSAPETELARAVGISTTFPGVFAILDDGAIDPNLASLYDNTDDAGLSETAFGQALGRAERDTMNRMWPGNMAIGLAHLVRSCGPELSRASALVPPNSAFAYELLRAVGADIRPRNLISDFTQAVIGGLYDARTMMPVPDGVASLLREALPEVEPERVRELLPRPGPSWRNVVPPDSVDAARQLLGLPSLESVSIGAGDSPLGTLAVFPGEDSILNVRGSTDSPMLMVDAPRPHSGSRETVLHYPMPWAESASSSPWCVVAPTLRSGKVWDWVRRLRYPDGAPNADVELERLACEALKRRFRAPEGSLERGPLVFHTALGGERAPDWDPRATGTLSGLIESHSIGDIALAALEGTSLMLSRNLRLMEERYQVSPAKLLLAGGPVKNRLWNWVTQVLTGKLTSATTFSDASLLGAALLGYGASYDGVEDDVSVSERLRAVSRLSSAHPLVRPTPVEPPDEILAKLEPAYRECATELRQRA